LDTVIAPAGSRANAHNEGLDFRADAGKTAAPTPVVAKTLTRIAQTPAFLELEATAPAVAAVKPVGGVGTVVVMILQKPESEGLPAQYGRLFQCAEAEDGGLLQFSVDFVSQHLQSSDEVFGRTPYSGDKLHAILDRLGAWPTKDQDISHLARQLVPTVRDCVLEGKSYYHGARPELIDKLDALAEKLLRVADTSTM